MRQKKTVPPPTVGFRINIDGLVQSPEVKLSLVVGKEIQQAKKFPTDAPGRGDNRGEQSATRILCRIAGPYLSTFSCARWRAYLFDPCRFCRETSQQQGPYFVGEGSLRIQKLGEAVSNAEPAAERLRWRTRSAPDDPRRLTACCCD